MYRSILTSLLLIVSLTLPGSEQESLIEKANRDYADGLYNNAIKKYQQVLDNGYESAELYYNLGNACFKTDNLASAILYYEKAKRLKPDDESVLHNLKVANSRIIDKHEQVPVIFYKRWWNRLYNLFGLNTWTKIHISCFVILLVFASIFFTTRSIGLKKISFWTGLFILLITLMSFGFSYQKYHSLNSRNEAIVFDPSVTIKSSPNQNSVDLFVIHEGTKVKILDTLGEWHEIKIANGSVGWIHSSAIEVI